MGGGDTEGSNHCFKKSHVMAGKARQETTSRAVPQRFFMPLLCLPWEGSRSGGGGPKPLARTLP